MGNDSTSWHIPLLCSFYGHFSTERVPDPLHYSQNSQFQSQSKMFLTTEVLTSATVTPPKFPSYLVRLCCSSSVGMISISISMFSSTCSCRWIPNTICASAVAGCAAAPDNVGCAAGVDRLKVLAAAPVGASPK